MPDRPDEDRAGARRSRCREGYRATVSSSTVVAFVLATVVFALVPGPSVLFIVGRADERRLGGAQGRPILPQFVSLGSAHPSLQMPGLGLVFCAMATSVDVAWAVAAGSARGWFVSSPMRLRRVRGAAGLIVMGLGVGVPATGHRQS